MPWHIRIVRQGVVAILATLCLLACGPSRPNLTNSKAIQIVEAARSLPKSGNVNELNCVPKEQWPKALRDLGPDSICTSDGNVQIEVWSFFVEERGYLVAPVGEQIATGPGTDPAYYHLHGSLYWYVSKG